MSNFHIKWKQFLKEAQQDAKILRNINIKAIQKEMPQFPDEEKRDYFIRIQDLEQSSEYLNPIFPTGLVTWVESLPDNHFPRDGRKRFAKWLADAVYKNETDFAMNLDSVDDPNELRVYDNDVRYIADYFNGSQEIPDNVWQMDWQSVFALSEEWHDQIGKGYKFTGDYKTKDVVYEFGNGYTVVNVQTKHDLGIEGRKMGHCVGGYCDAVADGNVTIYSLRDAKNEPHATIEVYSNGAVDQIKGNGNSIPKQRYARMILQWFKTTDFDYVSSPDYLNLLSDEEVKELMIAASKGDKEAIKILPPRKIENLAGSTDSPELLDFFVSQVAAGTSYGDSDAELVITNTDGLIRALSGNKALSEDQVLAIAKINLNLYRPILGRGLGLMIGTDPTKVRGPAFSRPYTTSVATRIWTELGDELKSGRLSMADNDEEKLYYMESIMAAPKLDSNIKTEIVEYLISEPFVQVASEVPGNSKAQVAAVYGRILQLYISSTNPDKELVKKLYTMQKDEKFITVIQQRGRLNSTIVSSAGMSDDLVDEIIKNIKENSSLAPPSNTWIEIISAPNVSDSKKIEMLNVGKADTQYHSRNLSGIGLPSRGNADQLEPKLKWSLSDRSQSRRFIEAASEGKFSRRVVKYMIDSGMFDPHYTNLWADQQSKLTGKRPILDSIPYDSKEGIEIIKKARDMALQNYKGGAYTPVIEKEKDKLQEEIRKYFGKNIMTKKNFYDTIKEQLGINEEKGRSRQRGIYKFYCMLSYTLTSSQDRSRGLDDILADLRALPNVTIVTVAIRNQKVAEGRYIAGLAIKFIPSYPGEYSTPENTKARIVRDIKRLENVHSLFKLSTGLIRLE